MTKLPATLLEAEALAFARQEIAHWHSSGMLSEGASRAFVREQMGIAARLSTFTRMQVIAVARSGDEDAKVVLRDLILETRARREELPPDLDNYALEVLHGGMGHQPSGPKVKNKILRNIFVALTVAAVVDRYPAFEPTGRSRHRRSACAIVAEALGDAGMAIGQKAVEAIWRNYGAAMPTAPGWSSAFLKPS